PATHRRCPCASPLATSPPPAAAPTEPPTLSLHDALPIYPDPAVVATLVVDLEDSDRRRAAAHPRWSHPHRRDRGARSPSLRRDRSEEHTSELQSHLNLVCRRLLGKKKTDAKDGPSWGDRK